jgi:hypothetical protein
MSENGSQISRALDKLDNHKGVFIEELKERIYNKIRFTSRLDCTAILERVDEKTTWTWRISEGKPYAKRFVKFIRTDVEKRSYDGHELDSYLSGPIAEIVQDEYSKYITKNIDEVGKAVLSMIAQDNTILNSLRRQIAMNLKNSTTPLTNHAINQLTDALMQSLDISDQAAANLGHHISGAVGSATGHHVIALVAHSLTGVVGTTIAQMIGKFLATAAGKHLMMMIVKKVAVKAVVSGVVVLLASACGVAASGALIWWIVLPLVAAFAAYEAYEFPEKLGKKVSKKVADDMNGDLRNRNDELIKSIFKDMTKAGCQDFAMALVKNETVQQLALDMCN